MDKRVTILDKLREVHSRIPDCSFMYDDWSRLNLRSEELLKPCDKQSNNLAFNFGQSPDRTFPLMFVLLRASGEFCLKNGNARDYQNLTIGFVTPAESPDFDGLENEDRIEWCKDIARRFFSLYAKSGMFEALPERLPYKDVYNLFDSTVTGIYFELQVQETLGVCQLPLEVYPDPINPAQYVRDCSVCPPAIKETREIIYDNDYGHFEAIRVADGVAIESNTVKRVQVAAVNIRQLYYTGYLPTTLAMIAYYDEEENYIGGVAGQNRSVFNLPIIPPDGTVSIVVCYQFDNKFLITRDKE